MFLQIFKIFWKFSEICRIMIFCSRGNFQNFQKHKASCFQNFLEVSKKFYFHRMKGHASFLKFLYLPSLEFYRLGRDLPIEPHSFSSSQHGIHFKKTLADNVSVFPVNDIFFLGRIVAEFPQNPRVFWETSFVMLWLHRLPTAVVRAFKNQIPVTAKRRDVAPTEFPNLLTSYIILHESVLYLAKIIFNVLWTECKYDFSGIIFSTSVPLTQGEGGGMVGCMRPLTYHYSHLWSFVCF